MTIELTSFVMKCFEHIVKAHMTSSLPTTLDPPQFTYEPNRSTDNAVTFALYTVFFHLDKKKPTYVWMTYDRLQLSF